MEEVYLLKMSNDQYLYFIQEPENPEVIGGATTENPLDAEKMTEFRINEVIQALDTGSKISGFQRGKLVPDLFEVELYEERLEPISKVLAVFSLVDEVPIEKEFDSTKLENIFTQLYKDYPELKERDLRHKQWRKDELERYMDTGLSKEDAYQASMEEYWDNLNSNPDF